MGRGDRPVGRGHASPFFCGWPGLSHGGVGPRKGDNQLLGLVNGVETLLFWHRAGRPQPPPPPAWPAAMPRHSRAGSDRTVPQPRQRGQGRYPGTGCWGATVRVSPAPGRQPGSFPRGEGRRWGWVHAGGGGSQPPASSLGRGPSPPLLPVPHYSCLRPIPACTRAPAPRSSGPGLPAPHPGGCHSYGVLQGLAPAAGGGCGGVVGVREGRRGLYRITDCK